MASRSSRRLPVVDRSTLVLGGASLAFALGALSPWYALPPEAARAFGADLAWVRSGQVLSAIGAMLVAARLARPRWPCPRGLLWAGLGAGLLFPYGIATWAPSAAYLAADYHGQQSRIVKNVEDSFHHVQSQWKRGVALIPSAPVASSLPLRIRENRFFQPSSWNVIVDALGYNNSIMTFLRRGWACFLGGCLAALLGLYLIPEAGLACLRRDLRRILPAGATAAAALGFSVIAPSLVDRRIETHFARGEYRSVLWWSRVAERLHPTFRDDDQHVIRRAAAGLHAGEPDRIGLRLATGLQAYQRGAFDQARDCFSDVLAAEPHTALARGHLACTLVNLGVEQSNMGHHAAATDLFRQALETFPQHAEGLYDLMQARVANSEFAASARTGDQLREVEMYFQIPSMALSGQSYLHSAWARFREGELDVAWEEFRKTHDPNAWKR